MFCKRYVVIWFFLLASLIVRAQDLSGWDAVVLAECNTAENNNYLTEGEKQLILLMNLARTDGAKFLETIATPYLNPQPKTTFTRSLSRELKKSKNKPLLYSERELFEIAKNYALVMGNKGAVGHQNYKKRVKKIFGKYSALAENCDYGFDSPVVIVMRLLVDEGVSDLGHRKTILDATFKYVGVAIRPHKKWSFNCVQEFAG